MSNLSKRFKKELALVLAVTMAFGSMQLPGMMSKVEATDVVTPVEFGTPVLKMGVLSDVHLAYGYDTSESIQNKVKQYVKAVATLNKMSGDELDVVMLAGDYTGYGDYTQAKTFATASAAVMKHINSIEGNNTQFFMTYGNHDTEWNGQMDYEGWENVLRGDGVEVTNLTELDTVNIDIVEGYFGNSTFENLNLSGSTGFHYEATVNMTEDKTTTSESAGYGSIRLTIGKGIHSETEGTFEIAIRPNCDDVVLFHHGGVHETETVIKHVTGMSTELNQDITCKIQCKDGKLSFQMNEQPVLADFDLEQAGITDISLEPGYCAQQCAGTISNIKIWEDAYDLLEGVTPATDASGNALVNSGSYKYTKEVNGKTYTFLSVETESYYVKGESNVFRNDVLEWLDRELAATSKDSYVYVVSHAPIKETGVYGSDIAYDKNADWGTAKDGAVTDHTITRNWGNDNASYVTSSSINSILKDYPQVVYFSGHTHWTNRLESSIMADDYTAINVASVQAEDYVNSVSQYMDSAKWNDTTKKYDYVGNVTALDAANKDGYALYIEVDEAGNQKIQRVNITDSQIVSEVTLSGTASDDVIENPNVADKEAAPTISAYYTDNVNVTYNAEATAVTYGDAWVMAAPKADKSHLTPFTAEARKDAVIFNEGDFTLNEFKNTIGYGATLDFTFPTAYTEGTSKIIRYELALYDQDDNKICTEWIVGNWMNGTNGCAEGVDHTTATSLTYSHIYAEEQLNDVTSVHATLTAVSEFGATKTLNSTENVSVDWGIQRPDATKASRNMFDGFTGDRIILAANTGENREKALSVTESSDAFNSLAFTYDTVNNTGEQVHDEIVLAVDKEKYEANKSGFTGWSLLANNAKNMTNLEVKDTFVYEADFKIESGASNIFFTFRAPDGGNSHSDYSGLLVNEWGAELWLQREKIAYSGEFKLTDTNAHHLQIVSEPTCVTIWIDNTLVYYQQQYNFDLIGTIETDSTFVENEDGTYTHNNPYSDTITIESKLNSKNLIPAIAMYAQGAAKFTVSNQALYLYDVDNQCTEEDFGADESAEEKEYFDSNKVSVNDENSTFSNVTIGANSIVATQKNSGNGLAYFTLPIEASTTDTIVTELEFKPTAMEYDGNEWDAIAGIQIGFRTDNTNDLKLWMRTNGPQNLFHIVDGTHEPFLDTDMVNVNQTVQIKIISDNEKASVYVDGNLVLDNFAYSNIDNISSYTDFLSNNKPVFKIGMVNGTYEVTNISVRNLTAESKITGITPLTADDNLLITEGNIVSEANDFAVNGTNFYADMSNTEGTGTIYLFGKNNVNSPLRSYDGFAVSSLIKATGGKVMTDVASYGGKLVGYALEDSNLVVYEDGTQCATVSLNYVNGEYIRFTTIVSPKGFDIYADGIKVYTYEATGTADYSVFKYSVAGAKVRFLDAAVWYSGVVDYTEMLADTIRTYEATLKGYYSDKKAEYDAKVAEMKEAYEGGASSEACRKYIIVIEDYMDDIRLNGKAVNNQVQQFIPTKYTNVNVDIVDGSTTQVEEKISLFDSARPIEDGDAWEIELDVECVKRTTESHWPRIGLNISDSTVMIQAGTLFNGPEWTEVASLSAQWNTGSNWHMKWTVKPGDSLAITIIDNATGSQIVNKTISWSELQGVSGLTTFAPSLFFANVDCKVSNIHVLEKDVTASAVKTEAYVDANSSVSSWHQENLYIYDNAADAPDLQEGDVWIFEADLNVSDTCSRIGLSLHSVEGHAIVQGSTMYYNGITNESGTQTNGWEAGNLGNAGYSYTSGKWHVKYTVAWGSKIITELTNEAGNSIVFEAPWNNINNLPSAADFNPSIIFINTIAEISNIYVGYDLTPDIEKLNTAYENADTKKAEANVTNVSIQNIEEAQQDVAPVIATTAAYTKAEINAATKVLNDAIANAITGSLVTISDTNTGTATLYAASNEVVYIGYLDATYSDENTKGQLYIAGWTDSNGEAVTTWTEGAIPKVIDTKMLMVKYQGEYAQGYTDKYRVRFLSSVNDALGDYTRAGLVFSLTDEVTNPDINTGIVRDTTSVYKNVNAAGVSMNVGDVYDNYSSFMYGRIINKIPEDQTFYVRAFVELLDGTIVYGVTREITINASNLNIANQ